MPRFVLDTHTHTIASGHAYSTISEMIAMAQQKGLKLLAITEHGPNLEGSVSEIYFRNFKVIPRQYGDLELFMGIEADIMDAQGNLCISDNVQQKMDYIVASLHPIVTAPMSLEENTSAYIGAMQNPYVCTLGHIDDGKYEIDYEAVVKEAKKTHTLIELNSSSLHPLASRKNSRENLKTVLALCEREGVPIVIDSDAHICYDIANFVRAEALIDEVHFPEELIVNTSVEKFKKEIEKKLLYFGVVKR
ncbi:MAG: phosphatase [Lachnospiraceae bacterium]|nr:phosphatase [Lachnospiraceae bacterium]